MWKNEGDTLRVCWAQVTITYRSAKQIINLNHSVHLKKHVSLTLALCTYVGWGQDKLNKIDLIAIRTLKCGEVESPSEPHGSHHAHFKSTHRYLSNNQRSLGTFGQCLHQYHKAFWRGPYPSQSDHRDRGCACRLIEDRYHSIWHVFALDCSEVWKFGYKFFLFSLNTELFAFNFFWSIGAPVAAVLRNLPCLCLLYDEGKDGCLSFGHCEQCSLRRFILSRARIYWDEQKTWEPC